MKTTIIIIAVILVVAGIGIYYFASNSGSGAPSATTNTENAATPPPTQSTETTTTVPASNNSVPAAATAKAVSIKNFSFSPSALTVKTGTKVTWTNNDSVPHTVTSDSGLFDSGQLSPGQSFSFTFRSPGTMTYHCSIHPMMKGSITVQS